MSNDTEVPPPIQDAVNAFLAKHPHLQRLSDLQAPQAPSPEDLRETDDEKAERLATRRAVYQARWAAQVPPMFAAASLADLDTAQEFDLDRALQGLNIVLAGSVGTGKTYAAYALGNHLAAQGRWVQAITVVDLLAALRPDGNPGLAKAAHECQALILDDLGPNKATEFAVEQMTALMDLRIRESRLTIITTNTPEGELEAAWGGRFLDRIRFRRTVVVYRGESRRKAAW